MKLMKKSGILLGGALLLASLFTTSCNEVMSSLDNPVSSYLEVNVADLTIPTGDSFELKAESINPDNPITFTSSDESVVTVDANGVITGVADGEATITVSVAASANYQEGTKEVKVAVKRPLTFEALEDGQIDVVYNGGLALEKPIVYTIDGKERIEITATTSILVTKGQVVEFESANDHMATDDYSNYVGIMPQSKCAVYGNVMSMITPDGNFHTNKIITKNYALANLLYNYKWDSGDYVYNTVQHEKYDLMTPATTLTPYCYSNMLGYTGITKAPALPATKLEVGCYSGMFCGCASLTAAPDLPAQELANRCYYSMFAMCTSLTTAPALPAEELANSCYYSMFYGCTGITEAPALPATELANSCYFQMFQNCYQLEKAPALPAAKLASNCYNRMFAGCSELKEAPELKAESLPSRCYYWMFRNCSKLNKVTCLAKEMTGSSAIYQWLNGAGTDESVTERTFVRNTNNTSWMNSSSDAFSTNEWYVPNSWTIDPVIIKTIVLVPGVWDLDDARFAAYVWRGTPFEENWYLFSKNNDKWTATIPATYTGLVLVRLNDGTEVNWESKWNQTSDIDFVNVADNSTISITGWGADDYTITMP